MHSILGITYSLAPRACRSFTMCTLVKGKVSVSNPIHSSSNSAKLMSAGCPLCEDVQKNSSAGYLHSPGSVNGKQTYWLKTHKHIGLKHKQSQRINTLLQEPGSEGCDTIGCWSSNISNLLPDLRTPLLLLARCHCHSTGPV